MTPLKSCRQVKWGVTFGDRWVSLLFGIASDHADAAQLNMPSEDARTTKVTALQSL